MNQRQSLKAASENIQRLEDFNRKASADIKCLYKCIEAVISGEKTWCELCEEQEECQRECKGSGCTEWWMKMSMPVPAGEENADDSERILSASPTCGEGT